MTWSMCQPITSPKVIPKTAEKASLISIRDYSWMLVVHNTAAHGEYIKTLSEDFASCARKILTVNLLLFTHPRTTFTKKFIPTRRP